MDEILVDKLPSKCWDCMFLCEDDYNPNTCKLLDWENDKLTKGNIHERKRQDCPLKTIAQHDKELVEEVIEKIKDQFIYASGTKNPILNNCINSTCLNEFLDKVNKMIE